jgi:hypothetical protein
MSHVATCSVEIRDLEAFAKACEMLGMEFKEGQKTYEWYGQWVNDYHGADAAYNQGMKTADYGKCEHAVKVPGCKYEIGLVKNPTGTGFRLIWDFYGHGQRITQAIGKAGEKITDCYGARVAASLYQRQGYRVQVQQKAGKIVVKATR